MAKKAGKKNGKPRKTSIGRRSAEAPSAPAVEAGSIRQVTDGNFDQVVLGSDVPVLVDFWAPWCGPCKMVTPILEELARDYEGKLSVVKYNTEQNQGVAGAMNIRSIPTMVMFKDGEVADIRIGASSRAALEGWVERTVNPKPGLLGRLFGRN